MESRGSKRTLLLAQVEVHFYILSAVVGQQNNRRGKKEPQE